LYNAITLFNSHDVDNNKAQAFLLISKPVVTLSAMNHRFSII